MVLTALIIVVILAIFALFGKNNNSQIAELNEGLKEVATQELEIIKKIIDDEIESRK